jgi:hypothetical protein
MVPDCEPGEEVDVSVNMQASSLEGSFQVHWKMIDPEGHLVLTGPEYKDGIIVLIVVQAGVGSPSYLCDEQRSRKRIRGLQAHRTTPDTVEHVLLSLLFASLECQ